MPVTPITSFEQFKETINSKKVTIINFWASWNGPGRMIAPVFEKISEHPEASDIQFYKVDSDAQQEITEWAGIRALPSFIAFRDGEKMEEIVGANPQAVADLIRKYHA